MADPTPQATHKAYLQQCLTLAQLSPPKPTNFRVGSMIVSYSTANPTGQILSTGYTLELPGNTHAEQNALAKLLSPTQPNTDTTSGDFSTHLAPSANATLYTTLEPCGHRLSGSAPCVHRIITTRTQNPDGGIRRVVFGAKEPGTFVRDSKSCQMLSDAGVEWEYLGDEGLEREILGVAMAGHEVRTGGEGNPKKRMMELDPAK